MKPTQKSLKPHVTRWVQEDLITQDQANKLLSKYPADSRSPATMTFSIIGGLLCILGVILLVSANWQVIPREVKLGGLLSLLTASTLLGTESSRRKWHPAITEISYLFAALLPLVGLTLISQFFNLSGSGFTLVLTWFASILLLPFLSFSAASFIIWWMCLCTLIALGYTSTTWNGLTAKPRQDALYMPSLVSPQPPLHSRGPEQGKQSNERGVNRWD